MAVKTVKVAISMGWDLVAGGRFVSGGAIIRVLRVDRDK